MKKTLLLTHEYYPFKGGIANYLYGYFKDLDNLEIVTDQQDIVNDSHTHKLELVGKVLRPRWKKGLKNVKQFVKNNNIEIIFTPHIFPLGIIALHLKKELGIPYVISLHGLDINLAIQKDKKLAKEILEEADHIVVNSEFVKKIVSELEVSTGIVVLPPTFTLNATTSKDPELEKEYQNKKVLLTVGRLVPRKNHKSVINAVAELQLDDLVYLIVGQGPEQENLKNQVKQLNLEDKVIFLPNISHENLPNYYSLATLFVMPTINLGPDVEGYGIVYLEAASYGLPIIASKDTSAEDFISNHDNGILVDGTNPSHIALAIKELLTDTDLATSLGNKAKISLQRLESNKEKIQKLKNLLA